jgi:ubiquinone biosynthesis protein UbiJ
MREWIERLINQTLALDARSPERLKSVQNKLLEIKIDSLSTPIFIKFIEQGIRFVPSTTPQDHKKRADDSEHHHASVIVQGSISAFLVLAVSKNPLKAAKYGLRFEGDLATIQAIQALMFSLEIDWEELISRCTGDTLAHQASHFVRKFKKRQQAIVENFSKNTSLYLTEETRLLPTVTEVTHFMEGVDHLRSDVDRLEARIALLSSSSSETRSSE